MVGGGLQVALAGQSLRQLEPRFVVVGVRGEAAIGLGGVRRRGGGER